MNDDISAVDRVLNSVLHLPNEVFYDYKEPEIIRGAINMYNGYIPRTAPVDTPKEDVSAILKEIKEDVQFIKQLYTHQAPKTKKATISEAEKSMLRKAKWLKPKSAK